MVFLLLAILSSAMISIFMRISSNRIRANMSMLATNYLVCSLLGLGYAGFKVTPGVPGFSLTLWLGLISGVLYLSGFVFFQANTRRHGVVLSSVFMKLGLLVPMVMSVLLFSELPTASQIAGFCIAIAAIVLINWNKDGIGKGFGIGLILMLLSCGSSDAMAKIFDVYAPASLSSQYLCFTFATAFVLCVVLAACKKECPGFRELLFGTLIGIPNFFSAKFLLSALGELPAVVVYPSFNVATMLIVTLAGVAVFREQLSKTQWIAMIGIIAALILLNI